MGYGRFALTVFLTFLLLLLCLRLDGVFTNWLSIFWPIFAIAGVFFCCCCCLCCTLGLVPRPEARDVPPIDPSDVGSAGTPGSTYRSSGATPRHSSGGAED